MEQEPGRNERPVLRTYEEATCFLVPSLGADAEGRVFGSEEDLRAVSGFYEGSAFSERPYVYDEGLVFVQISNQLLANEAEGYGTVLRETV